MLPAMMNKEEFDRRFTKIDRHYAAQIEQARILADHALARLFIESQWSAERLADHRTPMARIQMLLRLGAVIAPQDQGAPL